MNAHDLQDSALQRVLARIRGAPECEVRAPAGLPQVRADHRLPEDLADFYAQCGGCLLWRGADFTVEIVAPGALVRSNPELIGEEAPDDVTDSWYIVARAGSGEAISIDLHPERLGRCYDSFWDRHGVPGECAVVALSFTELLERLFEARGGRWYWLEAGFPGYGDAYD